MQTLFLAIGICFILLGNLPAYAGTAGAESNNAAEEPAAWTTPDKGAKLILIGIAVDRKNMQPMEGIRVELSEIKNPAAAQTFLTKQDGNFYFKLEADKEYTLSAFGKSGKKEDCKTISTVNKSSSDILQAILQVEPNQPPIVANFEVKEAPKTASANYSLVFKVQLCAIKQSNSPYANKAREMFNVETENGTNGFVRYLAGNFPNLSTAKEAKKQLEENGYNRTIIVPYYNGQRISHLTPEDAQKTYGNK